MDLHIITSNIANDITSSISSVPLPPWVVRILLSLAPENGATDHTITSVGTGGPDGGASGQAGPNGIGKGTFMGNPWHFGG